MDALACELVERGEAPGAGYDGEALAAVLRGLSGARHEVLEQAVDGDGCLELVEGGLAGGRLADVGGRGHEPVGGMDRMTGSVIGFSGDGPRSGGMWMGRAAACSRAYTKKAAGALSGARDSRTDAASLDLPKRTGGPG